MAVPETITLKEMSEMIGVNRVTVKRWLPTKRFQMSNAKNSKLLYDRAEALAFLKARIKEDK